MPIATRRILIFILSLIPLGFIVYKTLINDLGADPAKTIVLFTGNWAFYFLIITLTVTPLRRIVQFTFSLAANTQTNVRVVYFILCTVASCIFFVVCIGMGVFAF
jgi:sulfoxide reductase heme-binding subunit YedZ